MQEAPSHIDFTYININLDKYNVLDLNYKARPYQPEFYPNIFDFYASCKDGLNMLCIKFCQTYIKHGKMKVRDKRTDVLTYADKFVDRMLQYYHLY